MKYEFRYVRGHYEVFDSSGNFIVSADTLSEARSEVEEFNKASKQN